MKKDLQIIIKRFINHNKELLVIIIAICLLIGFSIFNNNSFIKEKRSNDSKELINDSLLRRQTELLDALLLKIAVFDSIYFADKLNDSIRQEDIWQIKNDCNKIIETINK